MVSLHTEEKSKSEYIGVGNMFLVFFLSFPVSASLVHSSLSLCISLSGKLQRVELGHTE